MWYIIRIFFPECDYYVTVKTHLMTITFKVTTSTIVNSCVYMLTFWLRHSQRSFLVRLQLRMRAGAKTKHGRSSTSFDSSQASREDYSVAY